MGRSRFSLGASWGHRPQTLGEFVDATVSYLKLLQPLHPLFRGPLFLTGSSVKELEQVAPDLSNIESFTRRFGWDREADERWLTGVLPDRTMSREGTSEVGFRINLNSNGMIVKPEGIDITVRGADTSEQSVGGLYIEFPETGAAEFERLELARHLLSTTVDAWHPERASITDSRLHKAQEPSGGWLPLSQTIGWMNYFANPAVRRDLPPDVECESFGPGGVLLTLQHERPSADDAQALARAKAIREALLPGNWFEFEALRSPVASR